MTIEKELDWKVKARNSIVNNAIKEIYLAQDVMDLELRAFYVVASLGHIKEAKQEKLLDNLYSYKGNFKHLKLKIVEKVRMFLQRYIK